MKPAPKRLRPYLQQLLDDLESNCLDVVKVPGRRGGLIRLVQGTNAEWYQKLCGKYPSARAHRYKLHDTRIKRANVRSTLRVLISGRKTPSYLVKDLLHEAESLKRQDDPPF